MVFFLNLFKLYRSGMLLTGNYSTLKRASGHVNTQSIKPQPAKVMFTALAKICHFQTCDLSLCPQTHHYYFSFKEIKMFISFQSALQNPAYTLHQSSKGLCMPVLTAVHLQLYVMSSNFPVPSLPPSHHTNSPLHAASLEHPPDLSHWHLTQSGISSFSFSFIFFSTNCQWFLIYVLWFGSSQTLVVLSKRDQCYAWVAVRLLWVLAFFFGFLQSTSLVSTLE